MAPTTSLSGTVSDPSGSVIPGATLELTNTGTHWMRRTATDAQGRFQFSLVPPGGYDLQVAAEGFTPVRQQGINLDVDVPATLRLTLSVAASLTSITIHEDAPMVDSQSGTLRQVVGEQYIQDLPLNGRNAAALVYMAPGDGARQRHRYGDVCHQQRHARGLGQRHHGQPGQLQAGRRVATRTTSPI